MAPIDLSAAPFNLDDEAMAWVAATRDSFTPRDKLSQLFVLLERGSPAEAAEDVRSFRPGGITRIYSDDLGTEIELARDLGTLSAVPLLVSADLEGRPPRPKTQDPRRIDMIPACPRPSASSFWDAASLPTSTAAI